MEQELLGWVERLSGETRERVKAQADADDGQIAGVPRGRSTRCLAAVLRAHAAPRRPQSGTTVGATSSRLTPRWRRVRGRAADGR